MQPDYPRLDWSLVLCQQPDLHTVEGKKKSYISISGRVQGLGMRLYLDESGSMPSPLNLLASNYNSTST